MKIIYNRRLLMIVLAGAWLAFFSCKKNQDTATSSATELLSFGPTGAKPGDTIRFFGNNLDRVTEIDFTNSSVMQKDFISQTPREIHVVVPAETEKGIVTLKTPAGEITSKTQFNISVKTTVTSITGVARPGENVTIKGDFLNWVNSVTFNNSKIVTSFVSQDKNQLVVKVPEDAQTGTLVLSYGGTDSSLVETADTLHVTLPMVTSISPNPVTHASNITVTGTDLDLVKKILFAGVADPVTDFVSQSATSLVVKVPGSAIKGSITLVAASGVNTTSTQQLDLIMPAITAMAPNPADAEKNLTITGTNLDLVTSIAFQNADPVATFVSQSASQIVVKVPKGVTEGKITLGVANSSLTVQSGDILKITGAVPPPVISFPLYTDAVTANWNGWVGDGWGGTKDYSNSSPVREGDHSIKINYSGGWGSPLQLGAGNIDITNYTSFKISIYGGPGTNGLKVNLGINGNDSYTITLVEGKWTDYSIPLSSLGISNHKITDIILKEYNGTGGFTIYVDDIGLN